MDRMRYSPAGIGEKFTNVRRCYFVGFRQIDPEKNVFGATGDISTDGCVPSSQHLGNRTRADAERFGNNNQNGSSYWRSIFFDSGNYYWGQWKLANWSQIFSPLVTHLQLTLVRCHRAFLWFPDPLEGNLFFLKTIERFIRCQRSSIASLVS